MDQKKSFGLARRLDIFKTDRFDQFVEKCTDVPPEHLDSHFKPQSQLLHYAKQSRDVQLFKMETLSQDWSKIRAAVAKCGMDMPPPAELGQLNPSKKRQISPVLPKKAD